MALLGTLIGFLISLIISGLIIYIATKLLGEKEGFITAVIAALVGAVLFAIVSFLLGSGWIATLVGGIAWLMALRSLYKMGWLKSFIVAVVIWIITSIVTWLLPDLGVL